MNWQRGGTFLGFVVGLLVGLAAALALAVYVTKVPIPFVNKTVNRSTEQDLGEEKKNKDWNPNAALYGKNPAKPAPTASAAASAPALQAASASKPAAALAKPATDALDDLVQARSGAGKAALTQPQLAADPFSYFIQLGAFRTPQEAESQRAKLSLVGLQTQVSEREQAGRMVYRVRLGPFDKREEADKVKSKLDADGMQTALVRVQR